jgi:hypothetical protein
MADNSIATCPFCKEEVKASAVRCKHCRSELPVTQSRHGGVCPYCKEDIMLNALKCKHCLSILSSGGPKNQMRVASHENCGCSANKIAPARNARFNAGRQILQIINGDGWKDSWQYCEGDVLLCCYRGELAGGISVVICEPCGSCGPQG